MKVIGIDPGQSTGVAVFEAGQLVSMLTLKGTRAIVEDLGPMLAGAFVVFEDSRLTKTVFSAIGKPSPQVYARIGRNVGQTDVRCELVEIVAHYAGAKQVFAVSPEGKGKKITDAARFNAIFNWQGQSNQHTRDAAQVAYGYRRMAK